MLYNTWTPLCWVKSSALPYIRSIMSSTIPSFPSSPCSWLWIRANTLKLGLSYCVHLRCQSYMDLSLKEWKSHRLHCTKTEMGHANGKIKMDGLFRVERTLSIRIVEARIKPAIRGDLYSEILLDRHVRARTSTKSHTSSVFWAEEFNIQRLTTCRFDCLHSDQRGQSS